MSLSTQRQRGVWAWSLVGWILLGSVILFSGILLLNGYNESSLRQLIRWSARISLSLFCLAFAARGIHLWLQNSFSFWVLMNRKYWGISFALIHFIHLAYLVVLQYQFHPVFEMAKGSSLLAGGMAYLFVFLLFLTSFSTFSNPLSHRNWKRLHTIGGYWIWGIFMSSYWKRALVDPAYLPPAVMLVIVIAFRIYAYRKSNKRIKQGDGETPLA